jgi:hypothetical protein|tara:strand:+ start:469 stop:687 length:219 start_codon:yes stop_codon:yes gene_type:complete
LVLQEKLIGILKLVWGYLINVETEINGETTDDFEEKKVFILPELSLGYRYKKAKDFMFRAGVGFPQYIYIYR